MPHTRRNDPNERAGRLPGDFVYGAKGSQEIHDVRLLSSDGPAGALEGLGGLTCSIGPSSASTAKRTTTICALVAESGETEKKTFHNNPYDEMRG